MYTKLVILQKIFRSTNFSYYKKKQRSEQIKKVKNATAKIIKLTEITPLIIHYLFYYAKMAN